MKKSRERSIAVGYSIQLLLINDEVDKQLSQKSFHVKNIGKGGFRFTSEVSFELEDRVQVLLYFPDDHSQEVLGRICYREELSDNQIAYGFSVIKGFYTLHASVA